MQTYRLLIYTQPATKPNDEKKIYFVLFGEGRNSLVVGKSVIVGDELNI
jgi:hypothetical protein